MGGLKGKDLVSTRLLSKADAESVFKTADNMLEDLKKNKIPNSLDGKTVVLVFFSPSLRTRSYFLSAVNKLDGNTISYSHAISGDLFRDETLYHAMRILSLVGDAIVLRHPRDGSAALAAEAASIPVINAGDGENQHPTTALSYAFELWKKGLLHGEIALVGKLKQSRTVHSLAYLLSRFDGVSLDLVSKPEDKLPAFMLNELRDSVPTRESTTLNAEGKTVVYATRMQEVIPTSELLSLPKEVLLLRKRRSDDEITEHALNSLAVRMALLKEILGD